MMIMNSIELDNFKAFKKSAKFPLDGKSVLIYGENGAGKTSLFEAIKFFYFRQRIMQERIMPNIVGEDRLAEEERVISDYKHDEARPLAINIDDESYNNHDANDSNIFLVSYSLLSNSDEITIKALSENTYFTQGEGIRTEEEPTFYNMIVESVNDDLQEYFYFDQVKLNLLDATTGRCSLSNENIQEGKSERLNSYFNESILHVVRFVVLIECMKYFQKVGQPTLVLFDDCFNSLDAPNRTFMIKFMLSKLEDAQKIVLTHNTGFYNLFCYIYSNYSEESEKWIRYRLFKYDDKHFFLDGHEKTTKEIKDSLDNIPGNDIGNELRQRFEVLVYELSRLNNIGELQETRTLLDRLCKKDVPAYLYVENGKCKTVYDLVGEIYSNVTNGNSFQLAKRLKDKIDSYRNNAFLNQIQPWLVDLRLMQKVALHQASHGHEHINPSEPAEITYTLALLEKLERALNSVTYTEDVSSL